MIITDLFVASEHALTKVVDQIQPDQWSLEVPVYVTPKGGTLRTIINYHAYDDAWVPDVLAGKTAVEVGTKYDGDLLGTDAKASWHLIVNKAIVAVQALTSADLEKNTHLSYGDFPAKEYLRHIVSFRAFRAIDLARFIGVDDQLDPEFVQGLWDAFLPDVDAWRQMGVFGPAIAVADGASLQERLLGLVGRQPQRD
jgi:hypothetical protein